MKGKIYEFLKGKLYPTATCLACQYADVAPGRKPCNNCYLYNKFEFGKKEDMKLKDLTDGICDLINEH